MLLEAIIGVSVADHAKPVNHAATSAQIAFICIYIFFFATTWGPGTSLCRISGFSPTKTFSRRLGSYW
jgi:hypothetical protein